MLWMLLALAVLIIALAVGIAYFYRRPLPKTDGTLHVPGLQAPVEIIRDQWGVPHIYAGNVEDLLFTQGYVHAQDRLWQMEFNRRIGQGRLAEIFGEVAFETDRWLRTIGLARAAHQSLDDLDAETQHALESYARGVNAYVEASRGRLPLEFTLLRLQPEPWRPVDSLVWAKLMGWSMTATWEADVLRAALVRRLGTERAAQLHGDYPVDHPIVISEQIISVLSDRVLEHYRHTEQWLPFSLSGGMSNNWVVDGSKSASGKPLLANDPHLGMRMPSIWYECHLVSPELEVSGVSFPGVPGVVIGHNRDIAWGLTDAPADVQDVYVEKLDPDDPTRYEYLGQWERATVVREEIRVKGEPTPRVVEVAITRHGPIVDALSPVKPEQPGYALALKWTGHGTSTIMRALLGINRARDWATLREALRDWDLPAMNFVYADREGNIGFCMPGKVPIRAKGMGLVPVPGWTDEYEWVGWIPYEELPQAYNPTQHYLATANNQIAGEEYPYFLTAEWLNGYRARRIVDLLTAKEKLSIDDFARMQVDQYCGPAKAFCGLLDGLAADLLEQRAFANITEQATQVFAELRTWDHNLTVDSVPGAVYELTQHFAMHRVFGPWLGGLTDHFLGVGTNPVVSPYLGWFGDRTPVVLHRILLGNERQWLRDAEGKELSCEAILALALGDAIAYLSRTLGKDVAEWQWGKLHRLAFNHPLGARKPLDRIFSRGPYPYGGDPTTVWMGGFVPRLPIQSEEGISASWRQIVDLSDWDASRGIHATGQSGHPASKHYDDMIPLWRAGEYHPMLWSREKVERHAEARLFLKPRRVEQ